MLFTAPSTPLLESPHVCSADGEPATPASESPRVYPASVENRLSGVVQVGIEGGTRSRAHPGSVNRFDHGAVLIGLRQPTAGAAELGVHQ
jgi:hypothetical protein